MGTLIDATRRGVITEEVRAVAEAERITAEKIRDRVARGLIVIPRNVSHRARPVGIGQGLTVKINTNIGTSQDFCDPDLELRKAKLAIKLGSDTLMDLSTGEDLNIVRNRILKEVDAPLGTVPIYQAFIEALRKNKSIPDVTEDDMFNTIERHLRDGVDFITVHCGVTLEAVKLLTKSRRIMPMVSRGGCFHSAWVMSRGEENPLYKNFQYLLELAREYDACLSLGDALRPGCIADSFDNLMNMELLTVARLVEEAREKGVQCMVEGPGHMPLDQIPINVKMEKYLCKGAPYYVLGPIPTDTATSYDHIAAAIGGAVAAIAGADFLCVVTPAEHLALPKLEDIEEGVISAKIAGHVADIVRLGERASNIDLDMARARSRLDWKTQIKLSVNPEKAEAIHESGKSSSGACSMCGPYCALKIMSRYMER
ncbi:MAG: phosphomethylpyrimidine synthase ThiC [Candidatus Bathyarchaeia archaeon]